MPGRPLTRAGLAGRRKRKEEPVVFAAFRPLSVDEAGTSSLEVRLLRWVARKTGGGVIPGPWAIDVRRWTHGKWVPKTGQPSTYNGPTMRGVAMTREEFEGLLIQAEQIRGAFDAAEAQDREIKEDLSDA